VFLCSIRRTKIVAQVRPLPNYHGRNGNIYDMGWSLYSVGFNPTPCSYETLGLQLRHNPQALMEWRRMKLRIGVISEGTNPEKFHLQLSCPGRKQIDKLMFAFYDGLAHSRQRSVIRRRSRLVYQNVIAQVYNSIYLYLYICVRIVCIVMLYSYRC